MLNNTLLTIFSITNGRSTHAASLTSIERSVGAEVYPLHILHDMRWVDALNECIRSCETPYFVRLDDDFILHPKALQFLEHRVNKEHTSSTRIGFLYFLVWDVLCSKIRRGLKIYSCEAIRRIGGFRADAGTGRVDRTTNPLLTSRKFRLVADPSIVALHASGTLEEQRAYALQWNRELSCEGMPARIPSIEEQLASSVSLIEKSNRERKTLFYTYIQKGSEVLKCRQY